MVSENLPNWNRNCNASQISILGGHHKTEGSLYTRIIWVDISLIPYDTKIFLPRYERSCMVYRREWYKKQYYPCIYIPYMYERMKNSHYIHPSGVKERWWASPTHWFRQHLEILILRFFCYWSPDVTGRLKPNCCIACALRPQFQYKKTRRDQTAPNLGPKTSWTNMTFFWFYTQCFLNSEGSIKHILKTAMNSPYPNQHSSRQYKLEETILPGKWLTQELIRSKTSAFSGTRSR